jgi:hypothetical protein
LTKQIYKTTNVLETTQETAVMTFDQQDLDVNLRKIGMQPMLFRDFKGLTDKEIDEEIFGILQSLNDKGFTRSLRKYFLNENSVISSKSKCYTRRQNVFESHLLFVVWSLNGLIFICGMYLIELYVHIP